MEKPSIKASRCNLENFINQSDCISCCIFALQNEPVNEQKGNWKSIEKSAQAFKVSIIGDFPK